MLAAVTASKVTFATLTSPVGAIRLLVWKLETLVVPGTPVFDVGVLENSDVSPPATEATVTTFGIVGEGDSVRAQRRGALPVGAGPAHPAVHGRRARRSDIDRHSDRELIAGLHRPRASEDRLRGMAGRWNEPRADRCNDERHNDRRSRRNYR